MSARKASYNLREGDDEDRVDGIKAVKLETGKACKPVSLEVTNTTIYCTRFRVYLMDNLIDKGCGAHCRVDVYG